MPSNSGTNKKENGNRERPKSLRDKRKEHITHVLGAVDNDIERAAELLEITVAELRRWIRKLEIPECNDVEKSDTE